MSSIIDKSDKNYLQEAAEEGPNAGVPLKNLINMSLEKEHFKL